MDLQSKKRKQPCKKILELDIDSRQLTRQDSVNDLASMPQADLNVFGALLTQSHVRDFQYQLPI
jgi:hypothetical protein